MLMIFIARESESFLHINKIAIALTLESHLTVNDHIKIQVFSVYSTPDPSGDRHAGVTIVMKENINHVQQQDFCKDYM